MKTLHTLKAPWLIVAMVIAVSIGEIVAWQVMKSLGVRFDPTAVAAVCVGAVAAVVALLYDGNE